MVTEKESRPKIEQLIGALETLAGTLGGECTLDRARLFLTIAVKDEEAGVPLSELHNSMGTVLSTLTRNVGALSDRGERGREGLGLIRITFDPTDYRTRRVYLDRKGKSLVEKLNSATGRK